LEEDGLRIVIQLINNVCETGEWPKVFNQIKMIAFEEKPKATNYCNLRTIGFIAKIAGNILRRKIERKIKYVFGKHNSAFRKGKTTTDAIGTLAISQQTLGTHEEL
jgi:hypothetical protein